MSLPANSREKGIKKKIKKPDKGQSHDLMLRPERNIVYMKELLVPGKSDYYKCNTFYTVLAR